MLLERRDEQRRAAVIDVDAPEPAGRSSVATPEPKRRRLSEPGFRPCGYGRRVHTHTEPGPQVTDRNWFDVASDVRSDGGLLFGGPDRCQWHRTVLTHLAGVFRGDRMLECEVVDFHWNMYVLKAGQPPAPLTPHIPKYLPRVAPGQNLCGACVMQWGMICRTMTAGLRMRWRPVAWAASML